jgi:hypothetical protein
VYVGLVSEAFDTAFNVGGQLVNVHKSVPVANEACVYALWMCACWANSADGCLCAYEEAAGVAVTI